VPQFGQLRFDVAVHQRACRDRVLSMIFGVHLKLAMLGGPPHIGFGFENWDWPIISSGEI